MTVLEIKRRISRMKPREIKELHAHLVRLRHNTPEWKRRMTKKLRVVESGRFVTSEQLEDRIAGE